MALPEKASLSTDYAYALEPIVRVGSGEWRGLELLARNTILWTEERWDEWYSGMPKRVRQVRKQFGFDRQQFVTVNVDSEQLINDSILQSLARLDRGVVLEWTERPPSHPLRQDDHQSPGSGFEYHDVSDEIIVRAARHLEQLRKEVKVEIAFDDCGHGIDVFTRVELIAPNMVKIDGRLLHRARRKARSRYVMRCILQLAKEVGATTVTEWVENDSDLEIVRKEEADYAQGWKFGRMEFDQDGAPTNEQAATLLGERSVLLEPRG